MNKNIGFCNLEKLWSNDFLISMKEKLFVFGFPT